MQKWEYNFVVSTYFESHKEGVLNPIGWRNHSDLWEVKDSNGKTTLELLNEYGKWGWEIVSCVPFYDALQASYNPSHYIFVLKRPIIEAGRPTQTETTTPDQAEKKSWSGTERKCRKKDVNIPSQVINSVKKGD